MFYEDYDVMDGKTIRVFANRENIDLVECDEGNLAEADDEIVVEKRFSQVNDISVGDIIQIAGNEFKVTGIGTSPDYNALSRRCQIQLSTARCLEQYSLQRVHMINFMQQARVLRQRHIFMRSDLRARPHVMM